MKYILDIHWQAFQHLCPFAGKLSTVNISKAGFTFPATRFLPQSMREFETNILSKLPSTYQDKGLLVRDIAIVHAELLFIHPFREGNGRVARLLADLMSLKAGFTFLAWKEVLNEGFENNTLAVRSAAGQDYTKMEEIISRALNLD